MCSSVQLHRFVRRDEFDALGQSGQDAVERARFLRGTLRQTASNNRQQAALLWLEGCRFELDRRKRRSATFKSWLVGIEGSKLPAGTSGVIEEGVGL